MELPTFSIVIDPDYKAEDAISLDSLSTRTLYEDLLLGKPLPFKLWLKSVDSLSSLLGIVMFLHREVLLSPRLPGFLIMCDMGSRHGSVMFSHADRDLTGFLLFLDGYIVQPKLAKSELGDRVGSAIGWIRDYLVEDRLPHLGISPPEPRILDVGTNGFVLAETSDSLEDAWFDLFRAGYLRGVALSPDSNGRRHVLACRKSLYVPFDTQRAALLLTELERASNGWGEWVSNGVCVRSPEEGSLILVSHMMEVFLRI